MFCAEGVRGLVIVATPVLAPARTATPRLRRSERQPGEVSFPGVPSSAGAFRWRQHPLRVYLALEFAQKPGARRLRVLARIVARLLDGGADLASKNAAWVFCVGVLGRQERLLLPYTV